MTLTFQTEKSSPTPISSQAPVQQPADASQEPKPAAATSAIRIILADSQAIYRVGMKKVFALEDDLRVVAQAESLPNLHSALQRYPTDVVLLEGQMIAGTIDAIPEMMKHAPDAKLIVQVVDADESNIVELYRRGVRGVVPRSISPDLLIKCVRKIADGETWIDNQSISWVIEAYRSQASSLTNPRVQPKLSKKELAIISCITRGMRNKEIAYQIGTTEQVIKNYLRKVYDKLGVSDRLELALYCLHHQLLKNYAQDAEVVQMPAAAQVTPLRAKM
jgi:DNA-binding NarL/FixJ family response regulator